MEKAERLFIIFVVTTVLVLACFCVAGFRDLVKEGIAPIYRAEMGLELNKLLFNHRSELKKDSVGPKLGREIIALCRRNLKEGLIDERGLLLYAIKGAIPLSVLEKDLELFSTVRYEANVLLLDQEGLKREGGYSCWLRSKIIGSGLYSPHELEVFFEIFPKT